MSDGVLAIAVPDWNIMVFTLILDINVFSYHGGMLLTEFKKFRKSESGGQGCKTELLRRGRIQELHACLKLIQSYPSN